MKIDHIGYAVKRMERAKSAFEAIGYRFSAAVDDTDRNVKIAFGENDGYRIELVCPLDKTKESPVDSYLTGAVGIPYHICYQSRNLDEDVEALQKQGYKMLIEPRPAVAFQGRRVVFLFNIGFGLMEIVEE